MKKIFSLIVVLFLIDSISAQHKTLTLYYPNDSTNVISISNIDSMSIFICGTSKVRYGGKDYNTVLIGDQCWLKENLDVGTMIQGNQNATNDGVIEKYCYSNNPANCTTYGGLYQWNEAMQYSNTEGAKGICPAGWHIPTHAEFDTLSAFVGGDGNSLKAVGQGIPPNGLGTNSSGFSGLLGGNKETSSLFIHLTMYGHFWSSTKDINNNVDHLVLYYNTNAIVNHIGVFSTYGFNVRCIKN